MYFDAQNVSTSFDQFVRQFGVVGKVVLFPAGIADVTSVRNGRLDNTPFIIMCTNHVKKLQYSS